MEEVFFRPRFSWKMCWPRHLCWYVESKLWNCNL